MNTNCVISAVGRNSLHKEWIEGRCDFDLHLVVYDDSMESFSGDTPYVCHIKGYKLKVIYAYLERNPQILEAYDYFFLPDDDIRMGASTINSLFSAMRKYRLEIAQPALESSYFTWPHTLRNRYDRLRYTNFVEMMVPCFSKEALKKVLFTFDENDTGWGTETHWPLLIGDDAKSMAVVDDVAVVHTRPIQSGQARHKRDLETYLEKYKLETKLRFYGHVPSEVVACCDRTTFSQMKGLLARWIAVQKASLKVIGEDGCLGYVRFLFLFSRITQSQVYADLAYELLEKVQDRLGMMEGDVTFKHGMAGCCCLVEFLARKGFINDNPLELLDDLYLYIEHRMAGRSAEMSFSEMAGIGKCYLFAYENRQTDANFEKCNVVAAKVRDIERWPLEQMDFEDALDAMDLLNMCGVLQERQIRMVEGRLSVASLGRIGRAYLWYRLYLLTHDTFYLIRVQEAMKNLKEQLLTLADALKLAEIMFYEENCKEE